MSDIIDFMERMGGDAQLSQASNDELAVALSTTDVTPELQCAVLARDAQKLGALVGVKPACVLIAPPGPPGSPLREPTPATQPPPPEEEDDEAPSSSFGLRGAAENTVHRRNPTRD